MIRSLPTKKVSELARVADEHGFTGTDASPEISLGEYEMMAFRSGLKFHVLAFDPGTRAQNPGFRFLTVGINDLDEWARERADLSVHGYEDPEAYISEVPDIHRLQDYLRESSRIAGEYGSTYTPQEAIERVRREYPCEGNHKHA